MTNAPVSELVGSEGATNILGDKSAREKTVNALDALNLPSRAYSLLAQLISVEDDDLILSADQFAKLTERATYNKVTGLKYERIARPQIINMVRDDILSGDRDLVVMTTDMNDLKGLNDKFPKDEADFGLFRFSTWVEGGYRDAVESNHKSSNFATVNMDGEGSDSIKIVFTMKDAYKFTRELFDSLNLGSMEITLTPKTGPPDEKVKLTGGFGFYVLTNSHAKELSVAYDSDKERAGALFSLASQISAERMDSEKIHQEANIVNQIVTAKTPAELEAASDSINAFGARIPQILHIYLETKRKELEASKTQTGVE